jgi:carbon-monoxide dehydrogenase medium subunit
MKPSPFIYHRPTQLADALALLANRPNARVLAGGQSLMAMLNLRLASPDDLIDIGRIPELAHIHEEDGALAIGAMTRQRQLEKSPVVRARLPLLARAIDHVGHQQTRNWGTIGGSLCHLDPSAEIPAAAMAYDATLTVQSVRGVRRIAMRDFPLGMMTPDIEPGEMLTAIRFDTWPRRHGAGFSEFSRRHGDFAIAAGAALVCLDGAGNIARISLTLAGAAATPFRLRDAEQILLGRAPDAAAVQTAVDAAVAVKAMDDPFISSWYRNRIGAVVIRRALESAISEAKEYQS